MSRSAPHLRLAKRRPLALSETPCGVGEEFPSPVPAVQSSWRNQSYPSIPAQTRLLGPSSLPAPASPAAGVAVLLLQASPPTSSPSFSLPSLPCVSTRKESLGWSIPGPRYEQLPTRGCDFVARFQRQYAGRRNECGESGWAVPYHISCGDVYLGFAVLAV